MNTLLQLEKLAIRAAQDQQWDAAVEHNTALLEIDPQNVSALNRLGFCYLQTNHIAKAKAAYQAVLKIDQYNTIANKHLKSGLTQHAPSASLSYSDFIEEPGKTKTVQLCRVADQKTLDTIPIASLVDLVQKNHCIAVETHDHIYLGSLPDDLSFRLKKLIKSGNTYKTIVKSIGKNMCSVFIKEVKRSKKYQYVASFPSSLSAHTSTIHENLIILDSMDQTETFEEEQNSPPADDDDSIE